MSSSLPPPRDSSIPVVRTPTSYLRDPRLRLLLAAALVGACGALAAAAFRWLVRAAWRVLVDLAGRPFPWTAAIVLAPAVGGVLAVAIVRRFASEPEGPGVSGIRASLITSGGFVRGRAALAKAIACALTTTSGGSAGCEGPIARLSAGFGSWVATVLRIDRTRLPTVTACGAAASISALFNAPIAGVVFAVEIILGGYAIRSFAPLVVASATAAALSRAFFGKSGAIVAPAVRSDKAIDFLAYAVVGCSCGLLGAALTRLLDAAPRLAVRSRCSAHVRAALAGLMGCAMVFFVPGVAGVGYPVLSDIFAARLATGMLAAQLVARFVGTTLTLGSGGAGGVFSPSLIMGACTGSLVASAARASGVGLSAAPSSFAVVGAVASVAATSHAPFTAIVLVYELTDHYAVLLPAAIACVLSTLVSAAVRRDPVFDADVARHGLRRVARRASAVALRDRNVAPLVRSIRQTVPDTTPAAELAARRRYLRQNVLVVVDSHDGAPLGVMDLAALDGFDAEEANGPRVADLMTRCPAVQHDQTLAEAVARLVRHKAPALPVVDDTRRPVGLLWRHDLLDACARELASEFALPSGDGTGPPVVYADGVAAVPVPLLLVGRSMRHVDLRKRYGLVCLGIRRALDDGTFAPVPVEPSTVLTADDLLIVSGVRERIERIREPSGAGKHDRGGP